MLETQLRQDAFDKVCEYVNRTYPDWTLDQCTVKTGYCGNNTINIVIRYTALPEGQTQTHALQCQPSESVMTTVTVTDHVGSTATATDHHTPSDECEKRQSELLFGSEGSDVFDKSDTVAHLLLDDIALQHGDDVSFRIFADVYRQYMSLLAELRA